MELTNLIIYPFYFIIMGVLPGLLIMTLVAFVLNVEIENVKSWRMLVLYIICGAVIHFLFIA